MGWGEIKTVNPGRHKRLPKWSMVRNNLLHVKMLNANLSVIPSIFYLLGHEVYVTKPGERIKQYCNFCKRPWHLEETCWKKKEQMEFDRRETERLERQEERQKYMEELAAFQNGQNHSNDEIIENDGEIIVTEIHQQNSTVNGVDAAIGENGVDDQVNTNESYTEEAVSSSALEPVQVQPEEDLQETHNGEDNISTQQVDEINTVGQNEGNHKMSGVADTGSEIKNKDIDVKTSTNPQSVDLVSATNESGKLNREAVISDQPCQSDAGNDFQSLKSNGTIASSQNTIEKETSDDGPMMDIGFTTQNCLDVPSRDMPGVAAHEVVGADSVDDNEWEDFEEYRGPRPNKKRKLKTRSKKILIGSKNRILRTEDNKAKKNTKQHDLNENGSE